MSSMEPDEGSQDDAPRPDKLEAASAADAPRLDRAPRLDAPPARSDDDLDARPDS